MLDHVSRINTHQENQTCMIYNNVCLAIRTHLGVWVGCTQRSQVIRLDEGVKVIAGKGVFEGEKEGLLESGW